MAMDLSLVAGRRRIGGSLFAGNEHGLSCEEHGGNSSYADGAFLHGGVDVAAAVTQTVGPCIGGDVGVVSDGDGELEAREPAGNKGEESFGIDDACHGVGLCTLEAFGGAAASHDELLAVGGVGECSVLDGEEYVFVGCEDEPDVHAELLCGGLSALEGLAFALYECKSYDASVASRYEESASRCVVACYECEEVVFVELEFEVVLPSVLRVVNPEFVCPLVGFFDGDARIECCGVRDPGIGNEAVGDVGVSEVSEPLALFVVGGYDDAVHHASSVHAAVHLSE